MRVCVEREQGARLDEALEALLAAEPYLAYANFPPIARGADGASKLHRRQWQSAADPPGVLVARDEGGRPLAALCLGHRDFESQHFGIPMARIEAPLGVADEARRLPALRALYGAGSEALRQRGYQHVSAVSSTRDRTACWALQELGAFHVGTKISWMQPLTGRRDAHQIAANLRIEQYDKTAIPSLAPTTWKRLYEWSGQAFDRGPFVFDLTVPRERALGIYQVWTQKALTGEWADTLIVVRDGDEVVAFHSMMLLHDLSEAAGVGILGRGIGGTLPGYRGLFTALQKECAATRPLGAGFLENETQASTVQSINVFGKLGHLCLRSIASFHMRLASAGDGGRQARAGVSAER
jgi:hypothetical protein